MKAYVVEYNAGDETTDIRSEFFLKKFDAAERVANLIVNYDVLPVVVTEIEVKE